MIDGSVLQNAQRCFEKKSRVVVKMVVMVNEETEHDMGAVCVVNRSFFLSL